nr:uncharacterized protein LOC106731461 [Pelodiscus sinensis]|eukprot:XP_014425220.1 uncharacterized protein LOC106731461 [Pelodiscus sinensis]
MAVYSTIFLLLSILISCCGTSNRGETPLKGKESQESQKLKQDLVIAAMSIFLIISLLLILGCSFLHYKLMTRDNTTLQKEVKSVAIKSHLHHVETRIVLSPSQVMQLAAAQDRSSQGASIVRTSMIYKQPPSDVQLPPPASNESAVSFAYTDPGALLSAPRSHTPESFLSTLSKSGSLYSMEQHDLLYGSSRSSSRASLGNPEYKYEDGEESDDSGSTIFVPFAGM